MGWLLDVRAVVPVVVPACDPSPAGGTTDMMGTKIRNFAPLPDLSLKELVPKDNFYRHLEETLDLSFVRDLVRPLYAKGGRPSVDPVVFFKALPTQCPH
jgi:hypothetical protein